MLEKGADIYHISSIFFNVMKKGSCQCESTKTFDNISFFESIVLSSVSHWLSNNYLSMYVQGRGKV